MLLAVLTAVVLAVSAGCRSTTRGGASASASPPAALDGATSVCGLATVAQIQDVTGRQVPSFAITNTPGSPDEGLSWWCTIGVVENNISLVGRFDLRVTTTHPKNLNHMPSDSTFEDVAASPDAEPVTLDSVAGRGVIVTDTGNGVTLVWSYPEDETVATLQRVHPSGFGGGNNYKQQDAADLQALFALIGPPAPQAANGPAQQWSMYPSAPTTP